MSAEALCLEEFRYKSDILKITDIYVNILVPLFMLRDTHCYINNRQNPMLSHSMINNILFRSYIYNDF